MNEQTKKDYLAPTLFWVECGLVLTDSASVGSGEEGDTSSSVKDFIDLPPMPL